MRIGGIGACVACVAAANISDRLSHNSIEYGPNRVSDSHQGGHNMGTDTAIIRAVGMSRDIKLT